jgi:hypothetical protein
MTTLYCREGCPACESLADELKTLAIRQKVKRLGRHEELPAELPPGTPLPALMDEDHVFAGPQAAIARLTELAELKEDWYRYQSDACYCNE